jgi:hypothetical protein
MKYESCVRSKFCSYEPCFYSDGSGVAPSSLVPSPPSPPTRHLCCDLFTIGPASLFTMCFPLPSRFGKEDSFRYGWRKESSLLLTIVQQSGSQNSISVSSLQIVFWFFSPTTEGKGPPCYSSNVSFSLWMLRQGCLFGIKLLFVWVCYCPINCYCYDHIVTGCCRCNRIPSTTVPLPLNGEAISVVTNAANPSLYRQRWDEQTFPKQPTCESAYLNGWARWLLSGPTKATLGWIPRVTRVVIAEQSGESASESQESSWRESTVNHRAPTEIVDGKGEWTTQLVRELFVTERL